MRPSASTPPAPARSAAPLQLRLLGTASVLTGDGQTIRLEGKMAALLAMLAVEGSLRREQCASWLWPAATQAGAGRNLRQRIFQWRRATGHPLVEGGKALTLAPGVQVEPPLDPGSPQGVPVGEREELLAGMDFPESERLRQWLVEQRERLRRRHRDALAAAIAEHEAAGRLASAIELLQHVVAAEPLHEQSQRWLMRLHQARGDRVAAIGVFEAFEALLRTELGIGPEPETQALLRQIESVQPTGASLPAPRQPLPAVLRRPPRLIGRQPELAAMLGAWRSGRYVLMQAQAGMGKTRLLQELAAGLPGVVLIQARHGDDGVPFALLARLLRVLAQQHAAVMDGPLRLALAPFLPELGGVTPGGGSGLPLQVQRAVELALAAAAAHGLQGLLLDDLHLADAASLELLTALLGAQPAPGLNWGLARRDAEGSTAMAGLRAALESDGLLVTLSLSPLDLAQLRELVDSLLIPTFDAAALAPALLRHTGGNPLFALDTLKDLFVGAAKAGGALPLPAAIGKLVERRLHKLSTGALDLARVAAVAGIDFDVRLAEQVLRAPALRWVDAWAELEAAQVFHGDGFAHDLMLEAALRGIPLPIARHLHGAVADALAADQGRLTDPARLARHWQHAQRWAEAASAFAQAAEAARRTWRRGDEAELLTQAADAATQAGDGAQAFHFSLLRVEALRVSAGAPASVPAALALLRQAQSEAQRLHALLALANNHTYANDGSAGLASASEAEALAHRLGDPEAVFEAVGLLATARVILGQFDLAHEDLARVRGSVRKHADLPARYRYHALQGFVLQVGGNTRAACAPLQAALEEARQMDDIGQLHMSVSNLAVIHLALGEALPALSLMRQAAQLSAGMDRADGTRRIDEFNLSMALVATGSYGEALRRLEALQPGDGQAADAWAQHGRTLLAALWLRLGQPAKAKLLLGELGADAPPAVRSSRACVTFEYAALHGALDIDAVEHELARAGAGGSRLNVGQLRLLLAQAQGPAVAKATSLELMAEAARAGNPVQETAARLAHGQALKALNEPIALDFLHETRATLRQIDSAWVYKPRLWLQLTECFDHVSEVATATDAARESVAWLLNIVLPGLPEPLRDGFLHRNAIHRQLLSRARQS